ncbi:LysR family transcriptional regulator [Pseudomonas veronii]|uniref:LysR family transcriptional regulator n=1 Tax=Pseudomonas veronii TaxID=76761 RepID=UPI003982A3E7
MAQRPPPTPMLQAFVSAAQTGSFARAAFELNLTASAISHQIAGLEEWWGVQLFERHSRGVKLTTAGQALLPVTDGFFKELDTVLHSLNPSRSQPLYLSCTSSLCATWLIPRMHGAHAEAAFNLDLVLTSADIKQRQLKCSPVRCRGGDGVWRLPGSSCRTADARCGVPCVLAGIQTCEW